MNQQQRVSIFIITLVGMLLTLTHIRLQASPTGTYQLFLPIIQSIANLHEVVLIPYSANWKHLDDGSYPGTAWQTLTFNDKSWLTGFGELGYGDGDENTVVGFGSDNNNKQITTYFRRSFFVDDPNDFTALQVHLLRDDGAVVYLNGQEVLRSNMPEGEVISTTLALAQVTASAETEFHIQNINASYLRNGENVLAVEIHQVAATSSDVSFNLTLTGTAVSPKPIRFAAIGDYGLDNPSQQDVANLIQSWEPDFIITAGDNSYGANPIDENIGKYFKDYIYSYAGNYGAGSPINRFFPSLGNHDYTDGAGLQAYLDYFTIENDTGTERYYDFVQGDVHFFVIDSNPAGIGAAQGNLPAPGDGQSSNSPQGIWLQNGLVASTQQWNIVYFHHAPYSSSAHGNQTASLNMRWPFQAWGATAVIGGHDHTYERFNIDGIPYFVNGLGVESTNRFCNQVVVEPLPEICHERVHGAMLIEADSCQIRFQFITHNQDMIDSHTIQNLDCP